MIDYRKNKNAPELQWPITFKVQHKIAWEMICSVSNLLGVVHFTNMNELFHPQLNVNINSILTCQHKNSNSNHY